MAQLNNTLYKYTVKNPRDVYFYAKSVFPFDLFPDEIIIDENKVDIIHSQFFMGREVFSIPIRNINSVSSNSNGIFGSVSIEVIGFHQDPEPILFLWSADAARARRIINGLVCSNKQQPSIDSFSKKERMKNIEQLGRAEEKV